MVEGYQEIGEVMTKLGELREDAVRVALQQPDLNRRTFDLGRAMGYEEARTLLMSVLVEGVQEPGV